MTSQGRHRTRDRAEAAPFRPLTFPDMLRLNAAVRRLERKGYEVRALRLHLEDHGRKGSVVLHLAPAPKVGKYPEHVGWNGKYRGQNVGTTRRRNLETLLEYVEGLPDVRREGGEVDVTGGGEGVHDDA